MEQRTWQKAGPWSGYTFLRGQGQWWIFWWLCKAEQFDHQKGRRRNRKCEVHSLCSHRFLTDIPVSQQETLDFFCVRLRVRDFSLLETGWRLEPGKSLLGNSQSLDSRFFWKWVKCSNCLLVNKDFFYFISHALLIQVSFIPISFPIHFLFCSYSAPMYFLFIHYSFPIHFLFCSYSALCISYSFTIHCLFISFSCSFIPFHFPWPEKFTNIPKSNNIFF